MSSSRTSPPDSQDSSPRQAVLISTMNDVPGYRIVRVCGAVYGQTTLSRGFRGTFSADLKALVGGETKEFTIMIHQARETAIERMIAECTKRGGNAVVAMRFDLGTLEGSLAQACAYGTACIIEELVE